jgi:hypothetical protein
MSFVGSLSVFVIKYLGLDSDWTGCSNSLGLDTDSEKCLDPDSVNQDPKKTAK